MGGAEGGQVGLAVAAGGQNLHEFVDNRNPRVVVLLGVLDVVEVDLVDDTVVDGDGRAVAAANGPENETPVRESIHS